MEKHSYINALDRAFFILKEKNVDTTVANYLLEELMGWNHTKLIIHKNDEMPIEKYQQYFELIKRASENEPPQYIMQEAWFYGRKFVVNQSTLIPRQETEELVSKVLKDISDQSNLKILDIGTGTGDIAITLCLENPNQIYTATDISKAALKTAQINAKKYNADINFIESDLFENLKNTKFDVVISNPPYISQDEKNVMDESVLKYEPESALFAEDNGLSIYKKMLSKIKNYLTENGIIYLEFGYQQKNNISDIFADLLPDFAVEFYQDISGNPRYLKAYKRRDN